MRGSRHGSRATARAAGIRLSTSEQTRGSSPAGESTTAPASAAAVATLGQRVPEELLEDPGAILDRFLSWVSDTGLVPYPSQEEALLELYDGRHVVLSTPTGSGKSLVAQGLHFLALCEGRRSFYTAPIKALVSEKFFALCEQFGAENVGMLTGDASINWSAPIICCTAEVLANMALHQGSATDAPFVVMDEFHYYADRERGAAWQLPLLLLPRTQFLLMSATLGDTSSIEQALMSRTGREVSRVHSDLRPVPLDFQYSETPLLETVETLLEEGRSPIYIVQFTQREAAELAQSLTSSKLCTSEERRSIAEALRGFRFDSPYGKDVQRFVRAGIGLHHAGLLPRYRLLMERLSQKGLLKVICGTDTLGVGVNIPIRTVLFTKLSKFDGRKVGLLSVRDFKQIAGRAGRKGFDDHGSVVCQAPEHLIENKRNAHKARVRGRKVVKSRPPKGFVAWDEKTFQRLVHSPPETLQSRLRITHGLLVSCLQSEAPEATRRGGYRFLADLIASSHQSTVRKRRLLREAAIVFRSLRGAELLEFAPDEIQRGARVQVHEDLQSDFSLHQTLSLYLVEAAFVLDRESPDFALDLLSLVEAILDDPKQILYAQERRAKRELLADLKAQRVPYEERIAKLDELSWPKPGAEWIHPTFEQFAAKHPWVRAESIHPKSIARAMFENYVRFEDYVRREEISRVEGLLLRYLSQVHGTLLRSIPENLRNDEVDDVIGYLRTPIAGVDSSLLSEWERLVSGEAPPEAAAKAEGEAARARRADPARDQRAFTARVRAELHRLVRALAAEDYEEATRCIAQREDDRWDADRFRDSLADFRAEYGRIVFDGRARQADRTLLRRLAPQRFEVRQVLVDETGDDFWNLEGEIDLSHDFEAGDPLVTLRRIGS